MVEASLVKLPYYECQWTSNDDQSTLDQVMAWCRQATGQYLSQYWSRSLSPYGVTRPQWVKSAGTQSSNNYLQWQETSREVLAWLSGWHAPSNNWQENRNGHQYIIPKACNNDMVWQDEEAISAGNIDISAKDFHNEKTIRGSAVIIRRPYFFHAANVHDGN